MQLILQSCFKNELISRQKFFYETLHLWLVVSSQMSEKRKYIQLKSIPTNCLDVIFIVGHNSFVEDYLNNNTINEERIVVITCDKDINLSSKKIPTKTIYLSHQNEADFTELIKGDCYGFDYDLTESEILFYNTNNNDDIVKRIEMSFSKV